MGQKQTKAKKSTLDKTAPQKEVEAPNDFLGEIPEVASNICGLLADDYLIVSFWDDPMERDFCFYHVYDFDAVDKHCEQEYVLSFFFFLFLFAVIARPEVKRAKSSLSMNAFYKVVLKMGGRSRHIPKLIKAGTVPKLIFGHDGEQQEERDPDWTSRPILLFSLRNAQVMLGALFSFSPDGCVSPILALHIGMGLCRALASLHRAGFLHRFVTPYNFAIEVPFSLAKISERMLMIDLSLAKEWPTKPSYAAPFVGSPKYASVRVHREFNQAPADDIISMIFVVAEFISGKLPWRSVLKDMRTLRKIKADFPKSIQFRRLPNELRTLYRDMVKSPVYFMPDHHHILGLFRSAIARKDPKGSFELPKWLVIPYDA